ncbi:MAG: hypothetical protein NC218_12310 [Acetobacter sp.]|nr:hypothetical protein [Acetobacter sp.]
MNGLINSFDSLPKLVKIILAIPFLDIAWVIYRLCRSIAKNNVVGIVLGVLLIIIGIPFLWLVDIITLVVMDKVIWID